MFFMCCSVWWAKEGPLAKLGLHSKNGRGQTVDANQFRIGFLLGRVGILKNAANRAFVHEIDPAQIRGATR
jgi:hypothetical protein